MMTVKLGFIAPPIVSLDAKCPATPLAQSLSRKPCQGAPVSFLPVELVFAFHVSSFDSSGYKVRRTKQRATYDSWRLSPLVLFLFVPYPHPDVLDRGFDLALRQYQVISCHATADLSHEPDGKLA